MAGVGVRGEGDEESEERGSCNREKVPKADEGDLVAHSQAPK